MTHPSQWVPRKFADVGAEEQFVSQILEVVEAVSGTNIEGDERQEVRGAIMTTLTDGLIPAFLELRAIRESVGKDLPLTDRFQLYEDFARKAWKSHKDLLQRAATAMGFNIGFLYQEDPQFEAGVKKFRADFPAIPPQFEDFFRQTRTNWQKELRDFRNEFVEHQKGARADFKKFYDPRYAEACFDAVWRTIIDVLVLLVNLRLPSWCHFVEHNDEVYGAGWPNRFRFVTEELKSA